MGLKLVYASFIPGAERGSIAPAWFRVTITIVLVSNSTVMFSYPSRPWIPTRDITILVKIWLQLIKFPVHVISTHRSTLPCRSCFVPPVS
jgi:hypothetical protein